MPSQEHSGHDNVGRKETDHGPSVSKWRLMPMPKGEECKKSRSCRMKRWEYVLLSASRFNCSHDTVQPQTVRVLASEVNEQVREPGQNLVPIRKVFVRRNKV